MVYECIPHEEVLEVRKLTLSHLCGDLINDALMTMGNVE